MTAKNEAGCIKVKYLARPCVEIWLVAWSKVLPRVLGPGDSFTCQAKVWESWFVSRLVTILERQLRLLVVDRGHVEVYQHFEGLRVHDVELQMVKALLVPEELNLGIAQAERGFRETVLGVRGTQGFLDELLCHVK